jgi:hypothetical protein
LIVVAINIAQIVFIKDVGAVCDVIAVENVFTVSYIRAVCNV